MVHGGLEGEGHASAEHGLAVFAEQGAVDAPPAYAGTRVAGLDGPVCFALDLDAGVHGSSDAGGRRAWLHGGHCGGYHILSEFPGRFLTGLYAADYDVRSEGRVQLVPYGAALYADNGAGLSGDDFVGGGGNPRKARALGRKPGS